MAKSALTVHDQQLLDKALTASTEHLYDCEPAPAAVPSEEEIKGLLLQYHADTASAWRNQRDGISTYAARAVLALFARDKARMEERERCAKVVNSAAEETAYRIARSCCDDHYFEYIRKAAKKEMTEIAAAIRAQVAAPGATTERAI